MQTWDYLFAAGNMGLSSFSSTHWASGKAIALSCCVTVVLGHRKWYWLKPVCGLLLVFHYNNIPILCRFRDYYKDILVLPFFTHSSLVWNPGKGVSLELGMKVVIRKLESLGNPKVKPHDPTVISFDALPAFDRNTDTLLYLCTGVA